MNIDDIDEELVNIDEEVDIDEEVVVHARPLGGTVWFLHWQVP